MIDRLKQSRFSDAGVCAIHCFGWYNTSPPPITFQFRKLYRVIDVCFSIPRYTIQLTYMHSNEQQILWYFERTLVEDNIHNKMYRCIAFKEQLVTDYWLAEVSFYDKYSSCKLFFRFYVPGWRTFIVLIRSACTLSMNSFSSNRKVTTRIVCRINSLHFVICFTLVLSISAISRFLSSLLAILVLILVLCCPCSNH